MIVVPGFTPVTRPVLLTVAIVVMLLLQVPPGVASPSDIVYPKHADGDPKIAPGCGSTVTTVPVAQPVPKV